MAGGVGPGACGREMLFKVTCRRFAFPRWRAGQHGTGRVLQNATAGRSGVPPRSRVGGPLGRGATGFVEPGAIAECHMRPKSPEFAP